MVFRHSPGRKMSDAVALQPTRIIPLNAVLVAIPLAAALFGLLIRYFGYATIADDDSIGRFITGMCRWDCEWYVRLAEAGYDPFPTPKMLNAGNWAFFPLYPMMVAGLRAVTGLQTMVAATGLSIALSIAAARVSWPLLGKDLRAYTLFSVFLLAGPFSIYFTTFYTEVLFLFLTVAVFAALRQRQFLLAGVLAGLLSATRIVGVFIVFAILWEMWRVHRETGGTWKNFIPAIFRKPDWLLTFAVAPLGLFAYMFYLHLIVGDALAFSHVQRAWGRPIGNPLVFIWNALASMPQDSWIPTASQQLGLATLAGYALIVALIIRKRFAMAIYATVALTLPLFAGMASMLRFVAGLAPLPLMLSELLARNRWVFVVSLVVFLAAGYGTTLAWMKWALALV
jgi:hypothetical protein